MNHKTHCVHTKEGACTIPYNPWDINHVVVDADCVRSPPTPPPIPLIHIESESESTTRTYTHARPTACYSLRAVVHELKFHVARGLVRLKELDGND